MKKKKTTTFNKLYDWPITGNLSLSRNILSSWLMRKIRKMPVCGHSDINNLILNKKKIESWDGGGLSFLTERLHYKKIPCKNIKLLTFCSCFI